MGSLDRIACLATIFFIDEEKYANIEGHNRLVFILETFGKKPITRVLVDTA